MLKYVWLFVLAIPPWAAVEFDAPKWVIMVSAAPFFLFAMTLGNPDEDLLGEASGTLRKGALVVIGVGGLVLGSVLFNPVAGVLSRRLGHRLKAVAPDSAPFFRA